ncbi:hypothetical protein DCAR_0312088 [Daucus carota subsp. sativus]|uniref:DUF223 domain-containing protein n=1 Tax=Daucus carota subsp. sativus TaxID=79200 RepID=A0A169WAS6_DAUCS|nr:hypothetical protein DCAR_0312088 [Daucus carota subsp. sativus]
MDNFPYQMISNLRPHTTTEWRLKVRVTRMWPKIDRRGETVGVNMIFVDELAGRIHAWIPAHSFNMLQNLFNEGETYDVRNFVVRPYGAMQTERCFRNDVYIQLYHMTQVVATGGVDYIPRHVFQFTDLPAITNAALQEDYLIDVIGIMEHVNPIMNYRNKYNQENSSITFTLNDMSISAEVTFYNELAQAFEQGIRDADEHPVILIISSCKSTFIRGEPNLSNLPPTRFFINHTHEAVDDFRNALRLADWHFH